jgi:hypothetical protein
MWNLDLVAITQIDLEILMEKFSDSTKVPSKCPHLPKRSTPCEFISEVYDTFPTLKLDEIQSLQSADSNIGTFLKLFIEGVKPTDSLQARGPSPLWTHNWMLYNEKYINIDVEQRN